MGTGFGLVFYIAAPTFALLTLAAMAYLAVTPVRGPGGPLRTAGFALVLWLYVGLHLAAAAVGRTADLFRIADTAGMVVLAAFVAVAPRSVRPRRLDLLLLAFWGVQVLHCGVQALMGCEPVALAGNRNWAATLVAVLALWACHALRRAGGPRRGLDAPVHRFLLQGLVIAVSLAVVYACHCRATWVALALYALVVFLLKPCGWFGRGLLLAALLLVALGVVIAYPEKVGEMIERDIRLPLFANSLRMVRDHPVLGVGPGNFTRDFVAYRSTAQKARAAAAPVSDHPHCEPLNVALAAGVLAALLWAVVLGLPLGLPTGRSAARRLAHASLWLLLVHGLLDKPLVQPPTSILAVLFAGMLWRPWLRLRADGRRRPAALSALRLPVAAVAVLLGLYMAGRDLWQGVLFRRANLAEAEGQRLEAARQAERAGTACRRAYAAYEQSTRVAPRNVRTHAYAGICANNKLRDPQRALGHLRQAMSLEPDFAHLNGEAGLALGSLGRHEDAFPFFTREAQLFPFDIEPLQRLLLCAVATGRTGMLEPVHARLLANSVRKTWQTLGEEQARSLTLSFRVSLTTGRHDRALLVASALVAPADSQPAESPLYASLDRALVDALRLAPFGSLDTDYWQDLETTRRRWVRSGSPPVPALAAGRREAAGPEAGTGSLPRLVDTARLLGYAPACLQSPAPALAGRFVELRRAAERWLLDLERGEAIPDATLASLLTRPALASACGIRSEDLRGASVLVPAHPLQFLYRTQALGAMVRRTTSTAAIPFSFSPLVEATVLQAVLAEELRAGGLPPDSLPVVYDQARLQAFAAVVRSMLERSRSRPGDSP
jgi:O-antigen ligase/tetratricopeptide (TPR) repeat protein